MFSYKIVINLVTNTPKCVCFMHKINGHRQEKCPTIFQLFRLMKLHSARFHEVQYSSY